LSAVVVSQPKLLDYSHLAMLVLDSFGLCRTSADGQPSTRQTPAQVTCAHCQRSSGSGLSAGSRTRSPKCPSEPHIIQQISCPSTARDHIHLPLSPLPTGEPSGAAAHYAQLPGASEGGSAIYFGQGAKVRA
jgi:hypothetical protein